MFELFFNTRYPSPWNHLDNDAPLVQALDPVGYVYQLFFGFDGRIGRTEFICGRLVIAMLVVATTLSTALFLPRWIEIVTASMIVPVAWSCVALELKRWHDQGRSGWWMWIALLPLLGGLVRFAMLALLPGIDPNPWGER